MDWKKWITLPNLVILLSALFLVYKLYGLPQKVDNHEGRITTLEHEKIAMQVKQDLTYSVLQEVKADVKLLLKELK